MGGSNPNQVSVICDNEGGGWCRFVVGGTCDFIEMIDPSSCIGLLNFNYLSFTYSCTPGVQDGLE